ncbi:hypothetical protein SAMN04488563_1232 [Jiangella alkaliphila]|uniref:Uncharacterized protein n=1 Tax=Jiangella alkaliphila TaxID=419479 RepID=A0A1H2HSZ8_9ACTN|nr:hypothetical protein SAMN04488563_1232 [Jiangella alkaliphila]
MDFSGGSVSQHKATEERRYRVELAVVVLIGIAIAVGAVIAILSLGGSSGDDLPQEFGGLSAGVE